MATSSLWWSTKNAPDLCRALLIKPTKNNDENDTLHTLERLANHGTQSTTQSVADQRLGSRWLKAAGGAPLRLNSEADEQ